MIKVLLLVIIVIVALLAIPRGLEALSAGLRGEPVVRS